MIKSTAQKPSHSRLSTLFTCERKYYYGYELGIQPELKIRKDYESRIAPMHGGKAGHAALDAHFKDENWRDAIHDAWGDIVFRSKGWKWFTVDFLEGVVEQYIDARRPLGLTAGSGGKVIESELEGLIEIAPGVEIVVKIDLVVEYPDGDFGIVDHKFTTGYLGVAHYADLAYGYQLCMYAMAAEKMIGKEVRRGAGNLIWMGKQALNPESEAQRFQWAEDDLRFVYDDARRYECLDWIKEGMRRMLPEGLKDEEIDFWPKSPSRNCNYCDFNDLCARQGMDRERFMKLHYEEKRYE